MCLLPGLLEPRPGVKGPVALMDRIAIRGFFRVLKDFIFVCNSNVYKLAYWQGKVAVRGQLSNKRKV